MSLEIAASTEGEARFEVKQTLVCVDKAGKPRVWPEAVQDMLKAKGTDQ
jgi:acyl-CoA thioesterase FadM